MRVEAPGELLPILAELADPRLAQGPPIRLVPGGRGLSVTGREVRYERTRDALRGLGLVLGGE
ncbi:MAG: hypothetical protein HOY71_24215, partial [Nonomuraea sp.]|nr:hypothetical protein [Nonomuraea sp.]